MIAPLLGIEHLRVRAAAVTLLDDVSFAIREGETVGLVGESGSGKSTLALSILGLLPAALRASGRIAFEGHELLAVRESSRRGLRGRRLSMVFQEPFSALNPRQRVGAQVAEVARVHGERNGRKALADAVAMMERLGIHEAGAAAARYPHELSGGERQRVLLAMALLLSPSLLIADEPTSALDVTVQAQVLDLLRERQRASGMALLLITHDLAVVAGLCTRTLVMHQGRVVEDAPTRQLFTAPSHPVSEAFARAVPRPVRHSGGTA
ncbi:MAG: ABC transporter ATP-binding protein [Gemmatimonadaceae bacterium]